MSERRTRPSQEPVYSEADLLEFRTEWEAQRKEGERERELSAIRGRLDELPNLVRATVRAVMSEEKQSENAKRRADVRLWAAVAGAILVLVVPVESALVTWIFTGHP